MVSAEGMRRARVSIPEIRFIDREESAIRRPFRVDLASRKAIRHLFQKWTVKEKFATSATPFAFPLTKRELAFDIAFSEFSEDIATNLSDSLPHLCADLFSDRHGGDPSFL